MLILSVVCSNPRGDEVIAVLSLVKSRSVVCVADPSTGKRSAVDVG